MHVVNLPAYSLTSRISRRDSKTDHLILHYTNVVPPAIFVEYISLYLLQYFLPVLKMG